MTSIYDQLPGTALSAPEPEPKEVKRTKKRDTLTSTERRTGQRKLSEMVDTAFVALQEAMTTADHATSVKAALGILDRAGFGPKSTMDINTTQMDLSALSKEELAERALKIANLIRNRQQIENTITTTAVSVQ